MQYKQLHWKILFVLLLFQTGIHAQQTVSASGGNGTGTGGTVSYTVGQVVYVSNTGITGSVSQGVQQSYVITVTNNIEDKLNIQLSASTYPNPADDKFILKINCDDISGLSYQLFDVSGKLLKNNIITKKETEISIGNLASSVFFLKIYKTENQQTEIKTFKIVKE